MENKMIEKINIAELLKDCTSDMELDCTMFENVHFERIEKNVDYPIIIRIGKTNIIRLTKYGCWNKYSNAKCVIFPKGKTTWEGFQRPFKDGDILAIGDTIYIYNGMEELSPYPIHYVYVITDNNGLFAINKSTKSYGARFATEEEKQKLFDAIKEHGYRWDDESKTLKKLDSSNIDVNAFKPFDKVLVRDHDDCIWRADFYSHCERNNQYWCVCVGDAYKQCIPYNEETANLVGTTNDCPDKYKIWKDE